MPNTGKTLEIQTAETAAQIEKVATETANHVAATAATAAQAAATAAAQAAALVVATAAQVSQAAQIAAAAAAAAQAEVVVFNIAKWRIITAVAMAVGTITVAIVGTSWKLSTELSDYKTDLAKQLLIFQERQVVQQNLLQTNTNLIKEFGDSRSTDRDRIKTLELQFEWLKSNPSAMGVLCKGKTTK